MTWKVQWYQFLSLVTISKIHLDACIGLSRHLGHDIYFCPNVIWRCSLLLYIYILLEIFNTLGHIMSNFPFYWSSLFSMGVSFVVGVEFLDFYSGVFHIYLDHPDTLISSFYPIRQMAHAFQQHHKQPSAIGKENLFWPITDTLPGCVVFLIPILIYVRTNTQAINSMLFILGLITTTIFAQSSHANSHRTNKKKNAIFELLPTLKSSVHMFHHVPPHNGNFAIVTGHSNYILNYIAGKLSSDELYKWVGRPGFFTLPPLWNMMLYMYVSCWFIVTNSLIKLRFNCGKYSRVLWIGWVSCGNESKSKYFANIAEH